MIGHKNPADSYGGIIRIDEEQVQLMKRRGGVGHDLSHIRPTGSPVLNSALTSTGIVPFMERYSNSTREVAQDGRRGALMLSLSIKHPDAENFIDAKVETGKVTGANVSIKMDDEFMRAAKEGKKYHQQFPIDSDQPMYEKDGDDHITLLSDLLLGGALCTGGLQLLHRSLTAVVHQQVGVACLQQILCHGLAHDAQTNKTDFHNRSLHKVV